MRVRRFSAGLLLALLWPNAPAQPLRLQHFTPLTLEPSGPQLRVDYRWWYGFQNMASRPGAFLARVAGGLEVVDTGSLRVAERYHLARRDVCAVDFDGTAVVALVGCETAASRTFTLWRFTPTSRRVIAVHGLEPLQWPVSFAVGDGRWFVARGGGAVDAIDLRTGRVTSHRHRRTLQKGRGYTQASWLGDHRLGLNGTVVDVRAWHRRTLALGARQLVARSGFVIAYGTNGITVFDESLRLYRRLARGIAVDDVGVDGGVLYAQVGLAWDLWNLRTGRHLGTVLPDTPWLVRLLPG